MAHLTAVLIVLAVPKLFLAQNEKSCSHRVVLTSETLANIAQQHGILSAAKSRGEAVAAIAFAVAEYNLGTGAMGWLNGRFASEGKGWL